MKNEEVRALIERMSRLPNQSLTMWASDWQFQAGEALEAGADALTALLDENARLESALATVRRALQEIDAYWGKPLGGETWQERAAALTKRHEAVMQIARDALAEQPK